MLGSMSTVASPARAAKGDAMPFTDGKDSGPPHLQLEPVGSHDFLILQGFTYRVPEPQGAEYVVPGNKGERTDLASVPFFLQWFIRSYGKHTLAAVLHDHLWRKRPDVPFKESNRVFRVAMDELEVPFVRRWLMWAAVSLAWLAKRGPAWKVRIIAWVAAIVGLDAVTAWVLARDVGALATTLAVIFLVASLVLLWPHILVTVIGAPTLYLLAPSILVVLATVFVFLVVETAVYLVGSVRRPLAGALNRPIPPPPNRPLLRKAQLRGESPVVVSIPDVQEHPSSF